MKIQEIYYSSHFQRAFQKLPKTIKQKAAQKDKVPGGEKIFRLDCFHSSLKTHKLKGEFTDFWAFSIDYSHRILFEFDEENSCTFIDVGTHRIYD